MPIFEFENAKGKRKELFFPSDSAPKIGSEIEVKGVKYIRIPSLTNNVVDSVGKIDITSAKQFADVTGKKSGTYGDLLDLSSQLSEAREAKFGRDVIAERFDKEKSDKMEARRARNRARKLKEVKVKKNE